jgi:hypothetical protein
VPRGDTPVAHLATPQWQSFEVRMRARRAGRCLQRAGAALDDGSIDEASDALEEARQLSPLDPRIETLSARLETLKHPAKPASHGHFWTSAAIVAGLVVAGAAGWQTWLHRDQIALLVPKAHPDIDASVGLAEATPNQSATDRGGAAAAPTSERTDISQDTTTVQTTLIRPEQVIDTRETPVATQAESQTPAVATSGSDERSEARTDIEKPLGATSEPELSARSQRDAVASPLSSPPPPPEYRLPAVLPSANPTVGTSSMASAVPAMEPPRPTNAPMTAAATNAVSDAALTSTPAVTPANPPTPAAPTPATEHSPARDERVAIRAALSRYESAYNRLDVDAVRLVWPSLDQRALARAFDNLSSQRVALQDCNVDVSGNTARANCSGNASWIPKVGGGERSASRKWTFDLSESNGAWRITHVQAK